MNTLVKVARCHLVARTAHLGYSARACQLIGALEVAAAAGLFWLPLGIAAAAGLVALVAAAATIVGVSAL